MSRSSFICGSKLALSRFQGRVTSRWIWRRILTSKALPSVHPPDPPPIDWNDANPVSVRRQVIKDAKPFSDFLTDGFDRQHDYLRISVTERCNLRCLYCMPEEGVTLSPAKHLLTSPEIFYLSSLFVSQGVTKIRLTGGEPTIRKDIIPLMHSIGSLRSKGLKELAITTNGISLHRKLESMVDAGLTAINLSLDTLDPYQFQIMTRRNGFEAVQKSITKVLQLKKLGAPLKLKINCVVMRGMNEREIVPFVELGQEQEIETRFIEYMPFGGNKWSQKKMVSYREMLNTIRSKYPGIHRIQGHKNDTSKTFQVPGFVGKVGFITSMTNDFCGTCNRLRITSDGNLKVCLHGNAEVSLRDVLREYNSGQPIDQDAFEAIKLAEVERMQAQTAQDPTSGWGPREQHLLEIIGAAVKRKKEKHADMGDLENMSNRPMILIEPPARPSRLSLSFSSNRQGRAMLPKNVLSPKAIPLQLLALSSAFPSKSPARAFHNTPAKIPSTRSSAPDKASNAFVAAAEARTGAIDEEAAHISAKATSASLPQSADVAASSSPASLPHLTNTGAAHMVRITPKSATHRRAIAVGHVTFTRPQTAQLIRDALIKKGDVLATARIAGIMAAKQCPALIPLCHPIAISGVRVDVVLSPAHAVATAAGGDSQSDTKAVAGGVDVEAQVECTGQTGVEMEALTAVMGACLTVIDMVKGVDRGASIRDVRVVLKEGGRSGTWRDESWTGKA